MFDPIEQAIMGALIENITHEQYANAVNRLVAFALMDTGGASCCAQVLLSAYDGASYQLNVSALSSLDWGLYSSALIVIRGRTELSTEPHELIENGTRVFQTLIKKWHGLIASKR